jgi:hypothetical protein
MLFACGSMVLVHPFVYGFRRFVPKTIYSKKESTAAPEPVERLLKARHASCVSLIIDKYACYLS